MGLGLGCGVRSFAGVRSVGRSRGVCTRRLGPGWVEAGLKKSLSVACLVAFELGLVGRGFGGLGWLSGFGANFRFCGVHGLACVGVAPALACGVGELVEVVLRCLACLAMSESKNLPRAL